MADEQQADGFNIRDFLNLRLLLILAPIAYLGQDALGDVGTFALAALALIPLAGLVGESTEEIASYIGPKWGGLLNATLGNAAELIITIFAISEGKLELVRASIIGSILGNLLLVAGLAMLLGGLKNGIQKFDKQTAAMNATLVVLALMALIIPSFFDEAIISGVEAFENAGEVVTTIEVSPDAENRELLFSEGIAAILIIVYGASIAYQFVTEEKTTLEREPAETHTAKWSMRTALGIMILSVLGIVFMSEVLVHAVEGVTEELGLTELFIGIIIVPLVGNVAEHLVAVQVAIKNKMDLSMNIALGSSLQIALFVAPVLVFVSLLFDDKLLLVFSEFELVALAAASFVAALVAQDGESNWLEGLMLVSVYAVIGLAFFVLPA
ncbi:MAG: calcium/proton exchanger [Chloroflexi bacterium]|nr:calcium/proton exchanger [Chloroflexota bacterium]